MVLNCLVWLAEHHERPSSPTRIRAGLALDEAGRLPFHQATAALDGMGMRTQVMRRPLDRTRPRDLPVLLPLDGGGAVLVLERREGDARVFTPGTPEPYWTPLAGIESARAGNGLTIEADPTRQREGERPWATAARRHWFWSEAWQLRGALGYVCAAAVVVNLLAFAVPLFTMNVYDRIIPNRAEASLWVLAIGVVLALGLEFTLRLARAQLIDEVGRDLDARLSQNLFAKVLALPLSARSGSTGALARRVSEYEAVRDFFASTSIVLAVDTLFLVLFLAMIAVLAGPLVLVPLAGIVAMATAGFALQRAMGRAAIDAQADSSLQQTTLVEALGASETLKAIGGESRMLGRWRNHATTSAGTQERLRRLTATSVNLATLCQQGITVGLIIGGFYLFSTGRISMGAIIAITMIAGRALAPVGQIAFLMVRARQALLAASTLQTMMETPDERALGSRSVVPEIRAGEIVLDDAGFRYPNAARASLSNLSLTIRPGERIGVIGRVASGKSTFGRLLCGLRTASDGAVSIDGLDSRQYPPASIRDAFRYVSQDAELFSGTVRDNLVLGAARIDDAALVDAVNRSGAASFIGRDAAGFDLDIGERGQRLSGGQRAFLVLARALVSPSRLLFLDEPTGAMDGASERVFIDYLRQAIAPDQTLIISTHRHALLSLVDRLIVIDGGRIVADGPRDDVLGALAKGTQA
ncbi:type I secretion system permease/ATPase [Sphingomonas solaris]|uniref:Type I secretion system permease/ATPase n=2 Tax=Alterirhizorhabdus solaris TaxID=2529389 RepID=A0A558QZ58_9SPHN|nr:type I secretion system permease/ATPase [Sphingomonas solaris]